MGTVFIWVSSQEMQRQHSSEEVCLADSPRKHQRMSGGGKGGTFAWVDETLSLRDFPGDLMVKISPSVAGCAGSVPGRRAEIPRALEPKNQKVK